MDKPLATITGLAVRTPAEPLPQHVTAEHASKLCASTARQRKVLTEVYRRTEISARCSTLTRDETDNSVGEFFSPDTSDGPSTAIRMKRYADDAPALAIGVACEALRDADISPDQITHLVTVSCTGFAAPGFDIDLILGLPMAATVQRTHIGFMGCHGALNALRVAKAFAEADVRNRVLVCCVELCSLHFQYAWDTHNVVANSLFADGAAAFVVQCAASSKKVACVQSSSSVILPSTKDLMSWNVGNNGFTMTLSAAVPTVVSSALPRVLNNWLTDNSLRLKDIKGWAIHPGGPRIIDSVATCLGLDDEQVAPSRQILASYGNMSSPTVLFILNSLRISNDYLPCVVMAFGPGLTVELSLLG